MLQRPRSALLGALACLVALAVTGLVSHLVPRGESLDARGLDAFTRVRAHDVDGVLGRIVHLGDPLPFLLLGAAIVATALLRRRRRLAAIVTAVLLVSPLTAETLKLLTAQAREHSVRFADHIANASWPSGHATGAMTLALCAVLVAPPLLRPAVALAGALFAVSVGFAVVALVWHFPSDVVGAFFLSAGWALGGVAAARRWPDPVVERSERGTAMAGATVITLAGAAGLVALALSTYRPGALLDQAGEHPALFGAAGGIAALAALLAAVLAHSARSD